MAQKIVQREKRYVQVETLTDEQGVITPLFITWDDGRRFTIEKVLDRRKASSLKVRGTGTRYIVRIGGKTTLLFHENPRWFVELERYGEVPAGQR